MRVPGNRSRTLLASSIAMIVASPAAWAQGSAAEGLEEVIVTATKRSVNLQDVPLSVTAVSGTELTKMGIDNILSLEKAVPGLHINNKGNDPTIIMRGAGTAGTSDIAVPVYIDGMYRPNSGQALASYLDVERVEVLRGPQGTLFGRNTLGGLLNLILKKPDREEFSFGASTTLGDYELQRVEGYANVPLGETAAMRITASDLQRDPYVENTFDDDAGLKDADESYVRGQLLWAPTEEFDVTFTASYWEDTANGNADYAYKVLGIPLNPTTRQTNGVEGIVDPRQGIRTGCPDGNWPGGRPQAGNVCNGDVSAQVIDDPYKLAFDYQPQRDIEETSFSALVNWDVGFATVRGNFGYFDYSELRLTDTDLSINPALVAGQNTEDEAVQADINLNSNGDGPLQWTLGMFYYDNSGDDSTGAFLWGYTYSSPNDPYWAYWLYQGNGGSKSSAVYGQAEYSLTDELRITAGARYSQDERDSYTTYIDPATQNDDLPSYIVNPARTVEIDGDDEHTDYRLALQYDIADDVMLYASAATGYIAGGIQQGNTGNLLDPTEVDSYEIGVKSTLFDGRVRANAAYYYNEYDGLTTTVFIQQGGTILAQSVPGGSTIAQGLEAELEWAATDALRITAGLAMDNSEFDEFNVGNQFTEGSDFVVNGQGFFEMDGEETRFSPDLTLGVGATYDIDLGDMGRLVPGIYAYYSDEYKLHNAPYFWSNQDSYTTIDLSTTWYSADDKFSVRAYANNATDEEVMTEATVFSRSRAIVDYNAPMNWGVRAAYNF